MGTKHDFVVKNGLQVGKSLTVDSDVNISGTLNVTGSVTGTYAGFDSDFNAAFSPAFTPAFDSAFNAALDSAGVDGTGLSYNSTTNTLSISNTGVTAGTYGSASLVPVLSVNAQGQIDSAGTVSVAGVSSTAFDSASHTLTINTADGGSFDQIIQTKMPGNSGTYGSASLVPVVTVNEYGLVDSINTVSVAGVSTFDFDSATGQLTIGTADGGSFSQVLTLDPYTTSTLTEGANQYFTQARARGSVSVTDAGGDGALGYDSDTGVFTYTGPSAAEVRAHFSAGTGVGISSGTVSIGQNVDSSSNVIFGSVETTGNVTIGGNLQVNGATTTVSSQNLQIEDNMIYLNQLESDGSPTIAVDVGFAANVNDTGSYAHTGFFRDATDQTWKLFDNYTPEPDSDLDIDINHPSFDYGDLQVADVTAANITVSGTVDGVDIAAFKTAYDSHNHDGRYYTETEADSRFVNVTGDTMTGNFTVPNLGIGTTSITDISWGTGNTELAIEGGSGYGVIHLRGTGVASVDTRYSIGVGDSIFYMAYDDVDGVHRVKINSSHQLILNEGSGDQRAFHDGYHPNADTWTTSRTLSLSGDASGSVSWDGSADATLSSSLVYRELGESPVGNFGQFVQHSATPDFNSEPSYWGWSFVQGNTNAPNTSSDQWYRARLSLGDAYGKGTAPGDYWLEIAIPRTGGSAGEMWTRRCEGGSIGSWRQSSAYVSGNAVWHAGNDGSGSGLDADTLDGIQGSSFLRSDVDNTASGSYSFTNSYNEFGNSTGSVSNDGSWNARVNIAGSQHARLDVKSVSDGIITTLYSHTGQSEGRVGTSSNHSLALMTNGNIGATLNTSGNLIIGGIASNNHFNTVSSTRLSFGGGNDLNSYFIGTNMENFGGNYTKLDLRWHTGIRMGARQQYGGIRLYDSEVLGTVLFSVGKGDTHTRVESGNFYAPIMYDLNNTAYYFDGSATGDSIRVAGDIVAYYSDARLKDFQGRIDGALDKVLKINGYYYTENEKAKELGYNTGKTQVGVSAQEIEEVLPEVVKDAPIGHGYKTVQYERLVPLLIEAIKEQNDKIERLEAMVEKLINTNKG